MAAAAANAVLEAIVARGLLARVREQGAKLQSALEAELGQHPHVGDIRGRGLFRGVELVADRETKVPFDPALKLHARVKALAFEAGLICYPMGGTIDGQRGDHILLAPPFIIEDAQIDELVSKLSGAIRGALAA
jgi:adenosylmethionine-8-amino-7-oxononanoate aminotransferase